MAGEDRDVILITGVIDQNCLEKFRAQKHLELIYRPDCERSKLEELIAKAKVLITRSETCVDEDLIDKAPLLKIIARAAVGVANIAIDYASQKGILVLNTPGKNTNSAAELTIGLLLSMLRKLPLAYQHMKQGAWDRHNFVGFELRGKKIGIVGLGNVGHRVAKFAHGFDMEVYGYDPYVSTEKFSRYDVIPSETLKDLAQRVDILSVHVPLNRETRGMVNKEVLESMPAGAYVLNAARGGIIDERALVDCLNSGHVLGAGIDTWEGEPDLLESLSLHPQVYCSPHIGASTKEAQKAIGDSLYAQVLKALDGGVVDHPVNLPQIGVIDNPLVKPYAILAEKLGRLAGQLNQANPAKIEVLYRGDLAGVEHSLIRLGWMKGFVSCAVNSFVSFVNAKNHFDSLGLSLTEALDPSFQSFRSAIKFVLHYANGESLSVGGIVFEATYIRVSLVNDFYFEVEPNGNFLFIRNEDKPGVIGDLGSFLSQEGVNIDSFDLSRKSLGGEAAAFMKIDDAVDDQVIKKLMEIKNIKSVHYVSL